MRIHAAALTVLLMLGTARASAQLPNQMRSLASNNKTGLTAGVDNRSGQVLIEVRIGSFASREMIVRERADGEILLPLTKILTLAEIAFRRSANRLESTGRNATPAFVIDFKRNQLHRNRDRFPFHSADLFVDTEGVWVTSALLKQLVDVNIVYDEASADLEVRNAEQLPVGKRILREAAIRSQRTLLQQRGHLPQGDTAATRIIPGGARKSIVLDYQFAHQRESTPAIRNGSSTQEFSLDLGTAFPLGGGVFNVRSNTTRISARQSASWNWNGFDNSVVNQVQLGELQTRALESRTLYGVFLSNSEITPPFEAGTRAYGVNAPVGWWVDAFRGNTLVSESRNDIAERTLDVPLMYGTNVLEIVARGPQGEHRSYERSFHTPSMFARPGKLEYSFAGGVCAFRRQCNAAISADARYALGNRLTVRAGAERLVPSARPLSAASTTILTSSALMYGAISTVISQSLVTDALLQIGNRSSKADVLLKYEPTPHTMARVDFSTSTVTSLRSSDSITAATTELAQLSSPQQSRAAMYLRHSLRVANRRVSLESWGSLQSWNAMSLAQLRAGLSAQSNSLHLRPYVRTETRRSGTMSASQEAMLPRRSVVNGAAHFAGVDFTVVPSRSRAVGAWWMRSNVEAHRGRLSTWSTALARTIGNWRVDAAVAGGSMTGQKSFTLSILSELPRVQVSSVMSSTASRTSAVTQTRGAVVYDRSTQHWSLSSEPSTGRSGIAGVVFLDENADGLRQRGEPAVADALLVVNNRSVRTNRDGYFVVWGVPVQTAHQVVLDTASLSDPTWVPAQSEISVRARPGALASADIAVVRAGIVSGTVFVERTVIDSSCIETRQGCTALTNLSRPVRIVLRNSITGKSRHFDSFSDGTFHEEGIVPGEYQIEVDQTSILRSGLQGAPLRVTVRAIDPTGIPSVPGAIRLLLTSGETSARNR